MPRSILVSGNYTIPTTLELVSILADNRNGAVNINSPSNPPVGIEVRVKCIEYGSENQPVYFIFNGSKFATDPGFTGEVTKLAIGDTEEFIFIYLNDGTSSAWRKACAAQGLSYNQYFEFG